MTFRFDYSKFTGTPNARGWAQAYDFKPVDSDKLQKWGHLIAVIGVAKSDSAAKGVEMGNDINNVLLGREILSRFHEEYYGKEIDDSGPLVLLKKAISKIVNEFSSYGFVEIAAASIQENTLYMSSGGGSRVFILRDGILLPLLVTTYSEVKSASGFIKEGDVLLMGTSSFFKKFANGILKASLETNDLEYFTESFSAKAHSLDDNSGDIGVIVAKFSNELAIPKTEEAVFEDKGNGVAEPVSNQPIPVTKTGLTSHIQDLFKKLLEKKVYVSSAPETLEMQKKRKMSASVGVILLLVLLTSIFFGIKQKKEKDYKESYEKDLEIATHSLEEAENLHELNPERARELFLEGRNKVLGLSDKGIDDPQLLSLKARLDTAQGKILGEYEVTLEPFVDLDLLSDGFVGSQIVKTGTNIYVLDSNNKKAAKIGVSSKRTEIIAGPDIIDEVKAFAAYQNEAYLFKSDGIFEISGEKKEVSGGNWEGEIRASSYAGNLYVLEKSTSIIWRLSRGESVFGDPRAWLRENTVVDLTGVKSWAIDGNVWILGDRGVDRFSMGNQLTFKLSGDFEDLDLDYIFTDDETEYLYLQDKKGKRILVFTKEGDYKYQYVSEKLKDSSGFIVSEAERKLILLNGSNLLQVDLRHIN